MATYDRCPKCNEFGWLGGHTCSIWLLRFADTASYGTDWHKTYATSAEKAIEKWIGEWDSWDCHYPVAGGQEEPIVELLSAEQNSKLEELEEYKQMAEGYKEDLEGVDEEDLGSWTQEELQECRDALAHAQAEIERLTKEVGEVQKFKVSGYFDPVYDVQPLRPKDKLLTQPFSANV